MKSSMLGAVRAAVAQTRLGQAPTPPIPSLPAPPTYVEEAPVYTVKTSRGSFRDVTYSYLRNIQSTGYQDWRKFEVRDTRANRNVTFYYEPTDALVGGLCGGLVPFRNGLWIAYRNGATFVEPGVYHPDKSWDQMITESNSLRSGNAESFEVCGSNHRYPNNDAGALEHFASGESQPGVKAGVWPPVGNAGTWCIQALYDNNKVACATSQLSDQMTVCAPAKYKNTRIVAYTMAAWADSFTRGGLKDYVFCGDAKTNTTRATDPQYGHSYDVTSYTVSLVTRQGPVGTRTVASEGPFLEYRVATENGGQGNWHPITHEVFIQQMNRGQAIYPNVTSIRWWDDKKMVSPEQFLAFAKKPPSEVTTSSSTCVTPCMQAPNGTFSCIAGDNSVIPCDPTTGKGKDNNLASIIGYGGLALGGLLLIASLTGKKDPS